MLQDKNDLIKVFSYLKDFAILSEKKTSKYNVKDVDFNFDFENINQDNPYIKVSFDADDLADNHPVLTVTRPDIIASPTPSEELQKWLLDDWKDYNLKDVKVKDEMLIQNEVVKFSDTESAHEFDQWIIKRSAWCIESLEIEEARTLFDEFFIFYQQLTLQQDTHELYFGSNFLKTMNGIVDYPFVLRPAQIIYDISSKELKLVAKNDGTKIQRSLLDQISDVDLKDFKDINDEFEFLDPHPFDNQAIRKFIEPLLNSLTPFSKYLDEDDYKNFEENDEQLIIYERNSMIFTSRSNSIVQYLEASVESLENDKFPKHLLSFVNPNQQQDISPSEEAQGLERLANLGGESLDILLAKEANEEQLNIIKRLKQGHAGVLVQGPPGTGKTHTIANITGHLLSEGKTVLITSKSHKALSVLKDKLPEPIQALAVSLIDNHQQDMENSINQINEKVSSTDILYLEKKIKNLESERISLMEELGSYREKILSIKVQESESVVIAGQSMSLTQLAKFISENESTLNVIPGKVKKIDKIPLSLDELEELYLTNLSLSESEEKEFVLGLVDPEKVIEPHEFKSIIESKNNITNALDDLSLKTNVDYDFSEENLSIRIKRRGFPFLIKGFNESIEYELEQFIKGLVDLNEWSKNAIIAGSKGGNYLNVWNDLKEHIKSAYEKENKYVDKLFSNEFYYQGELGSPELLKTLEDMINKHGTIGYTVSKSINKKYKDILSQFRLNGELLSTKKDLQLALVYVDLLISEKDLIKYWNSLIGDFEGIEASYNTLEDIDYYLTWSNRYDDFLEKMNESGVIIKDLYDNSKEKTVEDQLNKTLKDFEQFGSNLLEILKSLIVLESIKPKLDSSLENLKEESGSTYNKQMIKALTENDYRSYREVYKEVSETYYKSVTALRREELLTKLKEFAPAWALAIREREGIHGNESVPAHIEDAWKFKQYSLIIDEVLSYNYNDLLEMSYYTGQKFRKKTAELAAEKAWYALILRTKEDRELQTTLTTWQMYMSRIGKGTGKRASRYRRYARELMKDAQRAIPTWIMPLDQVMNNMTPGVNEFDVVIIDEASQANITDLGSLFLGEKIIVVGDDRQVSPTSFLRDDEIQSLKRTYFNEEELKQYDILDGETSLYDLVGTVHESLMLKEHFRCVPEIIDFSSFDSYDGKISALRGSNNAQVFPALVEYRVKNGQYEERGKSNKAEAQAIGALVYGMTQTKAYDGLTIGVITMLSSTKQEELILREIAKHISPDEMEKRRIIVGRSSSFQGDERDIMILSLVQSNSSETPLRLHGPGTNNSRKKIYNVAVSRARDQLWVVHSLDVEKDLKHGDYRRKLIEHARNPYFKDEKIDALSDSPFEKEVAKALIGRGYKVEQQKKVGTFSIDMVAYGNGNQVAIECDGERYHSGNEKLMEDLERQTVLERIGWSFIRLRGSEYYRDKEKAIDRICSDLSKMGVTPDNNDRSYFSNDSTAFTPELTSVLDYTAKKLKMSPEKLKKMSLPFYDPLTDDKLIVENKTPLQKEIEETITNNYSEKSKDSQIKKEDESLSRQSSKKISTEVSELTKKKFRSKDSIKESTKLNNILNEDVFTKDKISKENKTLDAISSENDYDERKINKDSEDSSRKNVYDSSNTSNQEEKFDTKDKNSQINSQSTEKSEDSSHKIQSFVESGQSVLAKSGASHKSKLKKQSHDSGKNESIKNNSNIELTKDGFYRYSPHTLRELEKNLSKTKYSINIIDHLGIISEPSNWNTEINLVSWSSKSVVYDLRKWQSDHKLMGKGVTLTPSELKRLSQLIEEVVQNETRL